MVTFHRVTTFGNVGVGYARRGGGRISILPNVGGMKCG